MQNDRKVGNIYEDMACNYLKQQGVLILQRNFRIRQGEIDIVGSKDGVLLFFEVKYRKNHSIGFPQEAVGQKKQKQICKVALFYYSFHNISLNHPCRFDVIAICGNEITWIKDAFPFCVA